MRSISANALNKLAQRLGTEPIAVVEVDWADGIVPAQYADRTVTAAGVTIPGKIVEIGDLDDAIDITTYNNTSKQVSVTLDDTDGSIKALFDAHDVHKRKVRIYQWFTGLDPSDMFLVFVGWINTPTSWSERDRTVKITVVSRIEDLEIGFSVEEGNFPYVPSDLVGKAWPMVFGTVYDYPALKIPLAVEGTLLGPLGVIVGDLDFYLVDYPIYATGSQNDITKARSIQKEWYHWSVVNSAAQCWMDVDAKKYADFSSQAQKILAQINAANYEMTHVQQCVLAERQQQIDIILQQEAVMGWGDNPVAILGGEDFPQDIPVWITVDNAFFHGHFEGNLFYVDQYGAPDTVIAQYNEEFLQLMKPDPCPHQIAAEPWDFRANVPCGSFCDIDVAYPCQIVSQGYFAAMTLPGTKPLRLPKPKQFWAQAGSKVRLWTTPAQTYVASIVPGTVVSVKAYNSYGGDRVLTPVPPELYSVSTQTFGSITAVLVTTNVLLSEILYMMPGDLTPTTPAWSDELYITFQSSVGPNVVDILTYIINNYTTLTCDPTSFAHVREMLIPFPANFPLLTRKNVIQVLKEIVFQARCAFWLEDNVVMLKYLPEEPTPVDTITVSDMDAEQGVEVELTETEQIVTKMNVKWHLSYAGEGEYAPSEADTTQYIILRHNVKLYGLQEQDYDWYIFNQPDIVLKCATFWLNRLSNAWKRVKFRTYLHKLNLEAFDAVTFDAAGYIASGPVNVVIEKADYNSAENYIDFECAVPVKAGKTEQDAFYWPAALPTSTTWPPQEDITNGAAGGGGIGSGATGQLPVGIPGTPVDGSVMTAADVEAFFGEAIWVGQVPGTTTGGIGGAVPVGNAPIPALPPVQGVVVGGPNVVYGPYSDRGDPTPTDVGFTAQPAISPEQYAFAAPAQPQFLQVSTFEPLVLNDTPPLSILADPVDTTIDLSKTKVLDSRLGTSAYSYLSDILVLVAGGSNATGSAPAHVMIDGRTATNAQVVTNDIQTGAPFDFKYDANGQKVGAGTAFLQS